MTRIFLRSSVLAAICSAVVVVRVGCTGGAGTRPLQRQSFGRIGRTLISLSLGIFSFIETLAMLSPGQTMYTPSAASTLLLLLPAAASMAPSELLGAASAQGTQLVGCALEGAPRRRNDEPLRSPSSPGTAAIG